MQNFQTYAEYYALIDWAVMSVDPALTLCQFGVTGTEALTAAALMARVCSTIDGTTPHAYIMLDEMNCVNVFQHVMCFLPPLGNEGEAWNGRALAFTSDTVDGQIPQVTALHVLAFEITCELEVQSLADHIMELSTMKALKFAHAPAEGKLEKIKTCNYMYIPPAFLPIFLGQNVTP